MAQYLDKTGLTTLVNNIKSRLPESTSFANADGATTLKYGTVGDIGEAVIIEEVFTNYIRITIQCHESEDQTYYVTQYNNVNAWLNRW